MRHAIYMGTMCQRPEAGDPQFIEFDKEVGNSIRRANLFRQSVATCRLAGVGRLQAICQRLSTM